MGILTAVVCAQCAMGMTLERIEPHARRARVSIEVYRCGQCRLVEKITRVETLGAGRSNDGRKIGMQTSITTGTRATA